MKDETQTLSQTALLLLEAIEAETFKLNLEDVGLNTTIMLNLNCLIYGDDPEDGFTVQISETANVSILKTFINDNQKLKLDRDTGTLRVWKVCFQTSVV